MEASKGRRAKVGRRVRAEAQAHGSTSAPNSVRVYVNVPLDLKRKIGALCELHGITISDLVQRYFEEKVRTHVISIRSGGVQFMPGVEAIRIAETDTEPGQREAV